jgi:hypothetical protein
MTERIPVDVVAQSHLRGCQRRCINGLRGANLYLYISYPVLNGPHACADVRFRDVVMYIVMSYLAREARGGCKALKMRARAECYVMAKGSLAGC